MYTPDQQAALTSSFFMLVTLLVLWSIIWKGIALWKAARRDQMGWYVALFIINTAGLLEIIYIFAVAPRHAELGEAPGPTGTVA